MQPSRRTDDPVAEIVPDTPPIPFFGAFDEHTEGLPVSSTFDRGSLSVDINGLTDVQAP
jgi:hypothetical protein